MPSVKVGQLWQGTTSLPPWAAVDGQVEDSLNIRHDISIGGAAKRQALELIDDLAEITAANSYHFVMLRDILVAIGDAEVKAWDTSDGSAYTVVEMGHSEDTADITATPPTRGYGQQKDVPEASFAYLTSVNPMTEIRTAVSQDTIIVCNTGTTTALLTSDNEQGYWEALRAYYWIIQDDSVISPTTGTVSTFSDLPDSPTEGDYYYVEIGENLDPAGWYVYSALGYDSGLTEADKIFPQHGDWYRIPNDATTQPGDRSVDRLDPRTMPHRLFLDSARTRLVWDTCPWKHRVSGNSGSNPNPPFIGNAIKSVEFFSGRLFIVSDKVVHSSRGNDFFNLYIDVVDQIADRDYASVDITQSSIGNVISTAVMTNSILIACENGQLQFRPPPDETLTNINAILTGLTTFQSDTTLEMVSAHNFAALVDQFKDVHLYVWMNNDAGVQYLSKLTVHYPEALYDYTPTRLSFVDRTLFIHTSEGDTLTHDLMVIGGELVQTAWSRFETYEPIVYVGSWAGEYIPITQDTTDGYSLMNYQHRDMPPPSGLLYQPFLDRLEQIAGGSMSYDVDTNLTTVTLTGRNGSLTDTYVFRIDGDYKGTWANPVSLDGSNDPQFSGDLTGATQWFGFGYEARLDMLRLIPMDLKGLKIKQLGVGMNKSSDIEIEIYNNHTVNPPDNRNPDHTKIWQSPRYGVDDYGTMKVATEIARLDINGYAIDMLLRLKSVSLGPTQLTSIHYDTTHHGSGRR